MTSKKDCCLRCEFRRLGCHSNCKAYEEYKKRLEIIRNNKSKERDILSLSRKKRGARS